MENKVCVAVVFGGRSGEHEVSVVSAKNIIETMDKNKYTVLQIGITKSGKWLHGENAIDAFKNADYEGLTEVSLNVESGSRELISLSDGKYEKMHVDIFFPALHGPYGEDGTIQGLFEMANIPYTGCGVLASSVGMDKLMTKAVWEQAGLPVTPYVESTKREWEANSQSVIEASEEKLEYPVFVKPANMGSSVGINKAKNRDEFIRAMDIACEFDHRILIEKGLKIRELECAVLGNEEPQTARVGEVLVGGEFYDYNDKYVNGVSKTQIPANIPASLEERIREIAIRAYKMLDCSGLSRVDIFFDEAENKIYLNEINTMPGFTAISMYPKMWNESGLSYSQLIDKIIDLGFERHKRKNEKKISFDEAGEWFK